MITATLCASLLFVGSAELSAVQQRAGVGMVLATTGVEPEATSLLARPAGIKVEDVTIAEALAVLTQTSGVGVAFQPNSPAFNRRVNCDCESLPVARVLDRILAGTDFGYAEVFDQILIIRKRDPGPSELRGQLATQFAREPGEVRILPRAVTTTASRATLRQGTVTGRVLDAQTRQPVAAAQVSIGENLVSALTQANGSFTLPNVPVGTHTLTVRSIGYVPTTQTVTVAEGQTVSIELFLNVDAVGLEEIVAVGYGTARRADVTGSVGVVRQESIRSIPLTSPDQALVGQIAGVNVTTPTGLPGAAPQVRVRGLGAVGAGQQPLYVVDGFALPQPENEADARLRNPLANIPVSDIESITVLKDASAAAIYGSRASNGVVIITTKSGQAGSLQASVTASSGVQNDIEWTRPRMANARQFVTWQKIRHQAMVDEGLIPEIPEPYRNPEAYGEGTDWYALMRRQSYTYDVQASVSGGNEAVRAFFSTGVQRQDGVVPGTDFTRLSLRANVDAQITNQLRAGLRVGPSYSRRNQPTAGGEGRQAGTGITMLACPLGQAYDEEGNLLPFIDSGNICPGVWRLINPLYAVNNIQDERNALTALASGYLHLDVTNFLSIRTNLNAEWSQNERKFFQPSTIGSNNNPPPSIPTGSYSSGRSLNWLSETTVNLATPFGPGQLDGLAGITFQRQNTYSSTFSGQFPDDDIRTLNVASNITGNSNESAWSLVSYLARANYNWKERLVFTATSRIDGSSRFGARNRWGLFPSAAIAWNLHNEAFMSGLSESVPELRIRASYGVTGNNQIGNYSSLSTVQKDDYMLGGSVVGGRRVTTLGNEELGWERTFETNFAIDAALFDQRLGVTVELYNRRTTDLLIDHPLPTSSGFGTITANTGVVRNRGMEIAIHSTNLTRPGFNWSTDFAWSLNRNKVLSLPGGEPIYTGNWGGQPTHVTAEGQPLGLMIGLVHDGIYQNEAEVAAGPVDPGVQPGNIRWKDVNGDGQITIGRAPDGDYGIIGNPHPDFTFAINNAISLGRFDFRVNVTGRKGGDILRFGYYQSAMNVEGVFNVAAEYVENMWISEDQPGTMPTPIGNREAIRRFHTQHSGAVADGSNIWVRSATLRYNVPQGFAGLGQMSIYLSALNPLVFTSYRGNPDVEANQSAGSLQLGVEDHAYPIARQFTVGVEMSF